MKGYTVIENLGGVIRYRASRIRPEKAGYFTGRAGAVVKAEQTRISPGRQYLQYCAARLILSIRPFLAQQVLALHYRDEAGTSSR